MANHKTQLLRIPDDYHLANLEITITSLEITSLWLRINNSYVYLRWTSQKWRIRSNINLSNTPFFASITSIKLEKSKKLVGLHTQIYKNYWVWILMPNRAYQSTSEDSSTGSSGIWPNQRWLTGHGRMLWCSLTNMYSESGNQPGGWVLNHWKVEWQFHIKEIIDSRWSTIKVLQIASMPE